MKTKIYQIAEGYCYNSDSLFLWDFILPSLWKHAKVLELGSGSGIIGLLCAREKNILLYQIEKQKEYAYLNSKNSCINKIPSCIFYADCKTIFDSRDLLACFNKLPCCNTKIMLHSPHNLQVKKKFSEEELFLPFDKYGNSIALQYFDIIVTNPPFYSNATLPSLNLFKEQATQSQHLPLESLVVGAKKLLQSNGRLIFCYAPSMILKIFRILEQNGFGIEKIRFVHPRIEKPASLVLISARRNSRAQTHILPPLITHQGKGQQDNTQEVSNIYKQANTQSIKIRYEDILWNQMFCE